jgi:hypothetical protein
MFRRCTAVLVEASTNQLVVGPLQRSTLVAVLASIVRPALLGPGPGLVAFRLDAFD